MANRKYSDDTALATWAGADLLGILDVSDPTDGAAGTSKKTTYTQLLAMLTAIYKIDTAVIVYTSTDTWTKQAGLRYIVVEVVAGGGGGGGVGTAAAGSCGAGNGGGGGAYKKKLILAAALGVTETATVGTGGAGGAAGNNNGVDGIDSSFGALVVSESGKGGNSQAASATLPRGGGAIGGAGGDLTGALGDVNVMGSPPIPGANWSTTNVTPSQGGCSFLSSRAKTAAAIGADEDGAAGEQYGGGASGGRSSDDGTDRAGGAGAAGVIIVTEYY